MTKLILTIIIIIIAIFKMLCVEINSNFPHSLNGHTKKWHILTVE